MLCRESVCVYMCVRVCAWHKCAYLHMKSNNKSLTICVLGKGWDPSNSQSHLMRMPIDLYPSECRVCVCVCVCSVRSVKCVVKCGVCCEVWSVL